MQRKEKKTVRENGFFPLYSLITARHIYRYVNTHIRANGKKKKKTAHDEHIHDGEITV